MDFKARRRMLIAGGGKAEPIYVYLSGWSAIRNADYGRKNGSVWVKDGLDYEDTGKFAIITENVVYFRVNMSLLKKEHKKLVIDAVMSSGFGYGYLSWSTGSSPKDPTGSTINKEVGGTRTVYEFDISNKNMADGYFYVYFLVSANFQNMYIYDVHFE